MESILLAGTDIATTRLGFGCGSLMRVRSGAARQRLLAEAFDAGIRHFDVARMYGLGAAERELAPLARGRRDRIVIATKFGIDVGPLGHRLRHVQGLLRPLIKAFPVLRRLARRRSEQIYQPRRVDAVKAGDSLETSLRELGTDYVDLFLIHEPGARSLPSELLAFLEAARAAGKIRAYGVAGQVEQALDVRRRAPALARILQIPNDAVRRQIERVGRHPVAVTFSPLSGALAVIHDHFRADPGARRRWCQALGLDLSAGDTLPSLLLRYCLRANPSGVVLYSTTRPERNDSAIRSVATDVSADSTLDAFLELVRREIAVPDPVERRAG